MLKHLNKHKYNLVKYSVATTLIAIPLYPKFPLFRIPGSQVSIRLEDILLVLIIILCSPVLLESRKLILKKKMTFALLVFFLSALVSTISAILITQSVVPHISLLHWTRRIQYLSTLFIGIISVRSQKDVNFYIKCILLSVIYLTIFGIGQKYFQWPVITTQNAEYAKGIALRYVSWGHLITTFAGHYDLATYLVCIMPLLANLMFSKNSILKKINIFTNTTYTRLSLFVVFGSSFWLLTNAASRISFVAYLGSVSLALLLTRKYWAIPLILVVSILSIGSSSNLIERYMNILNVTIQKIGSTVVSEVYAIEDSVKLAQSEVVQEDRSTSIRLNIEWPRAIRALEKNPLLGTGYSSITLATDNGYLRMLGEIGVLGFLSFGVFCIRIAQELLGSIKAKHSELSGIFAVSILSTIPGIMLITVFIDILEASKFAITFWLLIGIAISSIDLSKNE